jgi:lantibiotic biosynthesis protein
LPFLPDFHDRCSGDLTLASSPMGWKPLLHGEAREGAEIAATAILRCLAGLDPAPLASWTLDTGAAGVAVVLGEAARRGLAPDDAAESWLDVALDVVASRPTPPGLWAGYAGLAWAMRRVDAAVDDAGDVEARLAEVVERGRAGVDLYDGAAGFGMVALGRPATPGARRLLDAAVARLENDAVPMESGIAWRTMPSNDRAAREHPGGYFSTGLAHGAAGNVAFLAQTVAHGGGERARRLVEQGVAWLLSLRDDERDARYPFLVDGARRRYKSSVWCNGDIGVAVGLAAAARALGVSALESEAVATARHAFVRSGLDPRVSEPCLCHGAAGVAHLYNRLAQATGDEVCADAARAWFGRTLAMRSGDRGVAGFSFLTDVDPETGQVLPAADPSLLLGAGGVALALLAATSSVEPTWDNALGCSALGVA